MPPSKKCEENQSVGTKPVPLRDYTIPRVPECLHTSELAPPPPLPPPGTKWVGGGQHSLAGEGAGETNSDDWRERLAPCFLFGQSPRRTQEPNVRESSLHMHNLLRNAILSSSRALFIIWFQKLSSKNDFAVVPSYSMTALYQVSQNWRELNEKRVYAKRGWKYNIKYHAQNQQLQPNNVFKLMCGDVDQVLGNLIWCCMLHSLIFWCFPCWCLLYCMVMPTAITVRSQLIWLTKSTAYPRILSR